MIQADTPVRVLHLTARTDTGGLFRYVSQVCDGLHRRGHFVAACGQLYQARDLFVPKPWPWIDLPTQGGPWQMLKAARILQSWTRQHPVDLLHVHFRRPVHIARRVARGFRPPIPILFTLHLSGIPIRGWWRWLTDWGDHVHAASVDARDWLIQEARLDPRRITVIPHGIDANRFPLTTAPLRLQARQKLGLDPAATVALYVGRLEDPKNEDWLLDLAACNAVPGLQLLLVGTGPNESRVLERIQRQRLTDRVRLYPFGSPLVYYQAADALLLPSQIEGFSLVTIEAMATGLPVLRTRTAGTSETIIEGQTGRSTPIQRDAFLEAAGRFLGDRVSLRRMGEQAAAHVRERLTFEKQLDATLALYRRLLTGRDCKAVADPPDGIMPA